MTESENHHPIEEALVRPIPPEDIIKDSPIENPLIINDKKINKVKIPLSPEEQEALLRAQEDQEEQEEERREREARDRLKELLNRKLEQ